MHNRRRDGLRRQTRVQWKYRLIVLQRERSRRRQVRGIVGRCYSRLFLGRGLTVNSHRRSKFGRKGSARRRRRLWHCRNGRRTWRAWTSTINASLALVLVPIAASRRSDTRDQNRNLGAHVRARCQGGCCGEGTNIGRCTLGHDGSILIRENLERKYQ